MFKVKDKHGRVYIVYDVRYEDNKIYFLVYNDGSWEYIKSKRFHPLVASPNYLRS